MSGKKKSAEDEVEELLRAAEDDMLLKLSVDSHMSRASSSSSVKGIGLDLDRRFQALKSRPTPSKAPTSVPLITTGDGDLDRDPKVVDDHLFARFSALKGHPSSNNQQPNNDDDVDEVEKVIGWAMDAARLDPSPPSDSDDDALSDDDDLSSDGEIEKKGQPK